VSVNAPFSNNVMAAALLAMTEAYKPVEYVCPPQRVTLVKPSILVIEDDQDSRELLKILLELSGYEVTTAINGEQALSLLESRRPDLVLMETRLPDFDGLAFMRRLRSHWLLSQVPIVATSCNSTAAFRNEALAAGCNELLVKPLEFNSLERSLKKHLSQS
jgi:DNA-binding response OmpR family regulator